jgi:hypothetical protein
LHHLASSGTNLRDVSFVGGPLTPRSRKPKVYVDFNAFQLYRAAAGSYRTGIRLMHVWPSSRKGQWLALELEVLDHDGVLDLYHWLTAFEHGPDVRHARMLDVLAEPVVSPS